jgi:hypothetical protein
MDLCRKTAFGQPLLPYCLLGRERQVRRHRVARSLPERCRAILRCAILPMTFAMVLKNRTQLGATMDGRARPRLPDGYGCGCTIHIDSRLPSSSVLPGDSITAHASAAPSIDRSLLRRMTKWRVFSELDLRPFCARLLYPIKALVLPCFSKVDLRPSHRKNRLAIQL